MNSHIVIVKENWLTRKPEFFAFYGTFLIGVVVALLGYFYLNDSFHIHDLLPASGHAVFKNGQYWRLWTTLFAHADVGHLLGNLILLLPLSFMLSGHFGVFVFPLLGVFMGGVTNYIVLLTMSPETQLIGISGVVYWMGAAWLTLFLLIDHRKTWRQRTANALFLTVVLFIPESYKPEISYLSHFVGFVFGIFSGLLIYLVRRKDINAAEVKVSLIENDDLYSLSLDAEALNAKERTTESADDVPHPKSGI